MLQRKEHGEVHDRNVSLAAASARRMVSLVEMLLDAAVVGDEELRLEKRSVDLSELARVAAAQFAPLAQHARCELLVRAENPVPGFWDPARLGQAIASLLSNAFKYGISKPVEIKVEPLEGIARLTVCDQGIGLDEEQIARLFEAFQRTAPLRNYGGFGVGLYLTRRIVEAHGGSIRVRSAPGSGATFEVDLPRG